MHDLHAVDAGVRPSQVERLGDIASLHRGPEQPGQDAAHYARLWLRSALVPTASIGSSLGHRAMPIGLFLASTNLVQFGSVLFSVVLLFQLVKLPVEFNASDRAKAS